MSLACEASVCAAAMAAYDVLKSRALDPPTASTVTSAASCLHGRRDVGLRGVAYGAAFHVDDLHIGCGLAQSFKYSGDVVVGLRGGVVAELIVLFVGIRAYYGYAAQPFAVERQQCSLVFKQRCALTRYLRARWCGGCQRLRAAWLPADQ